LAGLEARGGRAEVADRRVWASVPLTPAGRDVLEPSLASAVVPTLVIGGGRDPITTMERQVEPLYAAVGGRPKALGLLPDAGHYTFSDLCGWAPTYDDCFAPYLEPAVAHAITNEAVDAFLDELRGVDAAAGSFPPAAAAEATFTVER
jgi:pimeloyl-ACP methyl ester carboxylesterase